LHPKNQLHSSIRCRYVGGVPRGEMDLAEFLRVYGVRAPTLMWLLGAGASASAGVPTADDMIWDFKRRLYCSLQRVSVRACSYPGDPALRFRLQRYFDSQEGYPQAGSDEEYARYFELAFPAEQDRRRYLEEASVRATPSFGHLVLAVLMKLAKARLVWTTNFDRAVEDAAASLLGSSGRIVVSTLDTASVARQALNEDRFPLLVKLHGDFHSRELKNTSTELQEQDAQMRGALQDACRRFGLVVVGYSGRDRSVMDSLEQALEADGAFPSGLFWLQYEDGQSSSRLDHLMERAREKRVDAHTIPAPLFDEVMSDLLLLSPDVPQDIEALLDARRPRSGDLPVPPATKGRWPIVRLNALHVSAPTVCRLVVCDIGGTKEVRETVALSGASVIAARTRAGVIAFGSDAEVRRAFAAHGISQFDLRTIDVLRLRNASSEHGLLLDAICMALARELPLIPQKGRETAMLHVDPARSDDQRLGRLKALFGAVCGQIAGATSAWAEAVRIRLEVRLGRLWLLFEPTVWVERVDGDETAAREAAREFQRSRTAGRFNQTWHKALSAWVELLTAGEQTHTVRALGIADGVDATFEIASTTAFSWRRQV